MQLAVAERLRSVERDLSSHLAARATISSEIERFERERRNLGFAPGSNLDDLTRRRLEISQALETAREDMRILETIRLSAGLERAIHAQSEAKARLSRAQERLGRSR